MIKAAGGGRTSLYILMRSGLTSICRLAAAWRLGPFTPLLAGIPYAVHSVRRTRHHVHRAAEIRLMLDDISAPATASAPDFCPWPLAYMI